MKYLVILGDGMADEPLDDFNQKTPLELAETPTMDFLASHGEMGMVKTVPETMKPGSDVANLAVLGYDPRYNYSGRSPLEALSLRIPMEDGDVIFRCNLVTLTEAERYEEKTILDHSAGEISTEDADILMDSIRDAFNTDYVRFHTGTSYRQIMQWKQGTVVELIPPHDHLGQVIGPFLPEDAMLRQLMEKSFTILNNHPINRMRAAQGKNKANSLWFWGAGTKPSLQNFYEKTGMRGTMISAVDLLKGIAVGTGMEVAEVPGVTGSLDTNYEGKAQAAVDALLKQNRDFAYIHVEAPDEMGHQGSPAHKILSIEYLDRRLIAPVKAALDASGEPYRLLLLPDHPTPVRLRTHTAAPVPYVLYDSTRDVPGGDGYSERSAAATGIFETDGYRLMDRLLESNHSHGNNQEE